MILMIIALDHPRFFPYNHNLTNTPHIATYKSLLSSPFTHYTMYYCTSHIIAEHPYWNYSKIIIISLILLPHSKQPAFTWRHVIRPKRQTAAAAAATMSKTTTFYEKLIGSQTPFQLTKIFSQISSLIAPIIIILEYRNLFWKIHLHSPTWLPFLPSPVLCILQDPVTDYPLSTGKSHCSTDPCADLHHIFDRKLFLTLPNGNVSERCLLLISPNDSQTSLLLTNLDFAVQIVSIFIACLVSNFSNLQLSLSLTHSHLLRLQPKGFSPFSSHEIMDVVIAL